MKPTLISIQGPTATGKTHLAVQLSKQLGIEIISADSRQFYKEMEIGTAKPTREEQRQLPHHFISFLSVTESYSASRFESEALMKINDIFEKGKIPVLAGGSGLYSQAVLDGFDPIPEVLPTIREAIVNQYREEGLDTLLTELKTTDPDFYEKADKKNFRRILRALEVIRATAKPYSSFLKKKYSERPFDTLKIALYFPKDILYERIHQRCDRMLEAGLVEEVRQLWPYRHLPALQTIGYTEFFDYFDHKYSLDEAVSKFKQHSRNYAKRQLSWLKREDDITWFKGDEMEEALSFILRFFS